jgi:hypothetical protein
VWCGDRDPPRARRYLGEKSTIAVTGLNARNLLGIVRAARGCQLIVNASASVLRSISDEDKANFLRLCAGNSR